MGEAEARQATERMDMSPQERLNNPPDYDVESNWLMTKPAEAPNINFDPALQYERPAIYAKGGEVSRETHDANLAKFLSKSQIKKRVYHGTADTQIREFKGNREVAAHFALDDIGPGPFSFFRNRVRLGSI